MPGTLGELVVSITTDLSAFNAGLKQAELDMRNVSGKINEYTNKLGLSMTAAGAAITGAFTMMVKSTVDYGDQIYEVSQRTGVAVETLSRLKYAADQTESSFEAVATGLKYLNKNIYDAVNGNKEMNDNFKMLGITLKDDVTGEELKADEVLLKVAEKFSTITDNSAKTNIAMQLFGRSGESLVPILNLGSEGIKQLSDEADRLNATLTTKNAKAIDQFGDDLKSLKTALGGLWTEITNQILPALNSFVNKATDVVVKIREWSKENPNLSKGVAGLGVAILGLGTGVLIVNQLIGTIKALAVVASAAQLTSVIGIIQAMARWGLTSEVALLAQIIGKLPIVIAAVGAGLLGWKLGIKLSEVTGLDEALSGDNGLFTKMWEWLAKNEEKVKSIFRILLAISTLGMSEVTGMGKVISGSSLLASGTKTNKSSTGNIDTSSFVTPELPTFSWETSKIEETVTAVKKHNEAVQTLNEEYISGKINITEYYREANKLYNDGIQLRQQEIEALQQLIELNNLVSDSERQGLQIAQEEIQMELDMAQQSISLEALATDAMYQRLTVMDESIQKAREYYQVKAELANQDLMDQQTTLSSATSLLQTMQSMHKTAWGTVFDFVNMGIKTFSSGFSTAISSIILGTKSASEAFRDFGKTMITAVVEFVVQYAVQAALSMALGATIANFVGGIADSIAASWMPAAYLAAVATMGGAVGTGTAALGVGAGAATGLLTGMKAASSAIGSSNGIKRYGVGGIAGLNGPELAWVGEKEPELITPFSKLENLGNRYEFNISMDGAVISKQLDIDDVINQIGVGIKRSLRSV